MYNTLILPSSQKPGIFFFAKFNENKVINSTSICWGVILQNWAKCLKHFVIIIQTLTLTKYDKKQPLDI